MKLYWWGWGTLIQNCCPYISMLWRHSCTRRVLCAGSLLEWHIYMPRNASGCRQARMNCSTPPRGTMALRTPSKTCRLQNPGSTFLSFVGYGIRVGQTTDLSVQWSPPLAASLTQMVEDDPHGIIRYDGKRAGWEGRPDVRHTCWFFPRNVPGCLLQWLLLLGFLTTPLLLVPAHLQVDGGMGKEVKILKLASASSHLISLEQRHIILTHPSNNSHPPIILFIYLALGAAKLGKVAAVNVLFLHQASMASLTSSSETHVLVSFSQLFVLAGLASTLAVFQHQAAL